MKQNTINVSLSGLDASLISQIAGEAFLGSPINLYRGYLNVDTGALLGVPYVVWRGIANDYSTVYTNNPGQENTVTINVSCKNLIVSILESENGRFTSVPAFQRINSNDQSMEFVSQMASFNPQFGKED